MEIKTGEYKRTKDGVIAKVTATGYGIDCDRDVFDLNCLQMMEIPPEHVQEYVIKHSFNIIDWIEEGDYVNGNKVLDNVSNAFLEVSSSSLGNNRIFAYMIKSIVTKEQFKAMEYEVK